MADNDILARNEIDALLKRAGDEDGAPVNDDQRPNVRPYDPRTQHRIIKERLHNLEIINQRFSRQLRLALFNLIRRNADITVDPVSFESFSSYARDIPVPTNLNLVAIKPLKGTALFVFPPSMVSMVVDNLFGGDGRFLARSDSREFTATEQRIIQRLLELATQAYQEAWASTFSIEVSYVRSEMQAKFANITNSPSEVVIISNFHMEVGNSLMDFQICIPYSMIEPLRDILSNPVDKGQQGGDSSWHQRLSSELRSTELDLVMDFVEIPSSISQVLSLKIGDILPISLPDMITARIDGVPVLECDYGSRNGKRALSVRKLLETPAEPSQNPIPTLTAVKASGDKDHE